MKAEEHNLNPKLEGWLSESEAQQLLFCKTTKLWQMRSKGLIKSSKFGAKTFYNIKSILDYLETNAT